jgi:hypothetical protein
MSDIFEGPGYWMASDAKWYPAEQHPDPTYRDRFLTVESSEPPEPEPSIESAVDASLATGDFPSVELKANDKVSSNSTGLSDIHNTIEATVPELAPTDPHHDEDSVQGSQSAFSVHPSSLDAAPQRPTLDGSAPSSVVALPTRPAPENDRSSAGKVELEIDHTSVKFPQPGSPDSAAAPLGRLSSSTALAVIPPTVRTEPAITAFDRLLAALVFCAGVSMIVGTFLNWTTGSLVQTGWDRGDGIATVLAGVVGSAAAGLIYVGYHHILPKAIAIASGLVGLVVVGLTAISVLSDSASANTNLGLGFLVVLVGSAVMTASGVAHRGEPMP